MGSNKEANKNETIASLRTGLSPTAQDLVFVVHSAAFEGVVHDVDMIKEMAEGKKVQDELSQLLDLFTLTGILPEKGE